MAETGSPEYSNDPGHDEDVYEDAGDLEPCGEDPPRRSHDATHPERRWHRSSSRKESLADEIFGRDGALMRARAHAYDRFACFA